MEEPFRRSSLQQYQVSDFIQWHHEKRLELNPDFQRRSVWTSDARTYLIDTILQGYPIPKIYLRTTIDVRTQATIRDVVDGQQRLRAILDFANDGLALNRRSQLFQGLRYSDLDEQLQETFLAYPIGVELLINATTDAVLEVFARLNSYTVSLNGPEKRHAQFQTELKWRIVRLASDHRDFLTKYGIIPTRGIVRMEDDAFFAELVAIILDGVRDGGSAALDRFYRAYRNDFPNADTVIERVEETIKWMDTHLAPILETTALSRAHQVQMLFAALAYQLYGIPEGRISSMPPRVGVGDLEEITDRLSMLAQAVDEDEVDGPHRDFVLASSRATTRMSSREVRFHVFSTAVTAK